MHLILKWLIRSHSKTNMCL